MIAQQTSLQDTIIALSNRCDSLIVVEDTTEEQSAIFTQLAEDKATRVTWDNARSAKKEAENMRERANKLTKLAKALEPAGKKLLSERKAAFENAVSFFLPDSTRFAVDLASSRLGLKRDGGIIHSAISGGETNQVLLALASKLATEDENCLLVPRDRAWDAVTLAETMASLIDATPQIIIMSTVEPAFVPDGWKVIKMEGHEG